MVAIAHIARPSRSTCTRPIPSAATYRRRRLVAAALALLLLVAVANLALTLLHGAGAGPTPVAATSVVVQPGDTVWSIAESLAGDGDVRPIVDAIVDANGGAGLRPGDRLDVTLP